MIVGVVDTDFLNQYESVDNIEYGYTQGILSDDINYGSSNFEEFMIIKNASPSKARQRDEDGSALRYQGFPSDIAIMWLHNSFYKSSPLVSAKIIDDVISLYQQNFISLGRAAEMAVLHYDVIINELIERGFELNFGPSSVQEAEQEEKSLFEYFKRKK